MEADRRGRDPARGRAESKAAEAGAGEAVTAQVRAAAVFVQAVEKKRRISWEFPVLR
jgi:hypothetical protein